MFTPVPTPFLRPRRGVTRGEQHGFFFSPFFGVGEGGDEDEDEKKKQEIDGNSPRRGRGWRVMEGLGVGVTATPEPRLAELRCRGNVDAWCDLTCNASLNLRKWNK